MHKKSVLLATMLIIIIILTAFLVAILRSRPEINPPSGINKASLSSRSGDEELAYLLVKLVLTTRAVIGQHYTRSQSIVPAVDTIYKRWLAKNAILPAAVADRVFSEVVPGATEGRAWVKMVVREPRNPNNRADAVASDLLGEIISGSASAERFMEDAYYYGEPIQTTATCLPCHGEPKGAPDPIFPQYQKNGWGEDETVGAVIARVAPTVP